VILGASGIPVQDITPQAQSAEFAEGLFELQFFGDFLCALCAVEIESYFTQKAEERAFAPISSRQVTEETLSSSSPAILCSANRESDSAVKLLEPSSGSIAQ
jgi:hypothetical protein